MSNPQFTVVVPAAGVGKRMQANQPKQYLLLNGKTILEHTIENLLAHPSISRVVVSISEGDEYFDALPLAKMDNVIRVAGGKERVDSVLSGLQYLTQESLATGSNTDENIWVLVHDAARPCLTHADVTQLIEQCLAANNGGILASPVRDTMKRAMVTDSVNCIDHTVDRNHLWHALTPQMFPLFELESALSDALANQAEITDEASAMERLGQQPLLVQGRSDNIKITQPEDLALAAFFLSQISQIH
ncbi:MAG: 2-C-methyl-D-erythritol 4-phosphate cytidylyltransferase [Vibrio sp.]